MASPVVESRIEPHKKAHFTLHLSDRIRNSDDASGEYSSVKYNHKPTQTSSSRSTTLSSPSSTNICSLRIDDTSESGDQDVFTFTGQKSQPKKSYVLIFDASSQQATLEPLSSSYTFNLATRNGKDISSQHNKIYPKKLKDDAQDKGDDDDLFGEAAAEDEGGDPDPDNPYDFRHFLSKEKAKRGDESDYRYASSPEHRTGTSSAAHTPQFDTRAPAATAPVRKPAAPAPKKRKPAATNPMMKPKKVQPAPAVRLQRTATEPAPKAKVKAKSTAPPASKIKSVEVIHSSDESDGEIASSPAPPSPRPEQSHRHQDEDDAEGESDNDGGLEIEVPDERPPRRKNGALAARGLGHNLNAGYMRSPSNGPISLASAANSDVEGSPNPHARNRNTQDEIDFGDLGGDDAEGDDDDDEEEEDADEEYNDRDVEPMDIGPPVQPDTTSHDRKPSAIAEVPADDDEDDLEELMRRGLEGGDSSEESEEE